MNPQPELSFINNCYTEIDCDRLISFYNITFTHTVKQDYIHRLSVLESHLRRKGRILDFGCAAGYFSETATQCGWESVGIDIGKWSVDAARRRGYDNIRAGLIKDMNFANDSFDAINASQVFEHLDRPLEMLIYLKSLVRPGGIISIDVPNNWTLPMILGIDDFASNMPPYHLNYFTPFTLKKLLRKSGLKVLQVNTDGGLKWENLVGIKVQSDILDAHEVLNKKQDDIKLEVRRVTSIKKWSRSASVMKHAVDTIAKPFLYSFLKLGMRLNSISRKA